MRLPAGKKVIALTFNLGERATEITGYDGDVVDFLRGEKIAATFFIGGKWMRSHPGRTKQLMADPLFEVGNHTWMHGNLRVLNRKRVHQQILWPQVQYEEFWDELAEQVRAQRIDIREMEKIPRRLRLFRFPYGTCSPESLRMLTEQSLAAIQWDTVVSGEDTEKPHSARKIVQTVLHQVRPGSVVVLHANGREQQTAKALPRIIPELRKKGFRFATVSQLLRLGTPVSAKECYELKPGDNLRYDKILGEGTVL